MSTRSIEVSLGDKRSYNINIGAGITEQLGEQIASLTPYRHIALICDSNIAPLYAKKVSDILCDRGFLVDKIVFAAGERSKSLSMLEQIHTQLSNYRFTRESIVVALGGGVVGDLAGFAASTYMRGVCFVQVPTTLLSMIDSSVGGKNGVNVAGVKNLVGNFAQPIYVSIDTNMLNSLPELEWKCGFGEMAKSAVIDSMDFSKWLMDASSELVQGDSATVNEAIARTVEFKAKVVMADEHESSLRKCLNYGHTLGHAIEAISQKPKILHGIAVCEGMRFAAKLACKFGVASAEFVNKQDKLLSSLKLNPLEQAYDVDLILDKMIHDKKGNGRTISFVLPKDFGAWETVELEPDVVRGALLEWMASKS